MAAIILAEDQVNSCCCKQVTTNCLSNFRNRIIIVNKCKKKSTVNNPFQAIRHICHMRSTPIFLIDQSELGG